MVLGPIHLGAAAVVYLGTLLGTLGPGDTAINASAVVTTYDRRFSMSDMAVSVGGSIERKVASTKTVLASRSLARFAPRDEPGRTESAVSRTCGAANSTTPSAVFIRPVRYPFR